MKTLTNEECSEWLAARGIAEAPYGRADGSRRFYVQLPLPDAPQRISYVSRCLTDLSEPFEEALLHFTDWPLYQPDEMAVVTAIRAGHGEQRPLIESPGHLFVSSERDLLAGLFSLAICYQWTAYLYLDHPATFLCWEGELLDCWAFDRSQLAAIQEIFQPYGPSANPTENA